MHTEQYSDLISFNYQNQVKNGKIVDTKGFKIYNCYGIVLYVF